MTRPPRPSVYLDIRADCRAVSTPGGSGQSHVRVRSTQLSPQPPRTSDGQHGDHDHDDHYDQTDHHPDGDGQHLVVISSFLLDFSFSNLLDGLVECLDQEVEGIAPAVLVLAPHVHLVRRPGLELSDLELSRGALERPDLLPGQAPHLQGVEVGGAGGEKRTGDLR